MQQDNQMPCPYCGIECRIKPSHYGKRVVCPKCKHQFAVPPPAPSIPVTLEPTVKPSIANQIPLVQTDASNRRPNHEPKQAYAQSRHEVVRPKSKLRFSTIVAFMMLGVTLLLPVSMLSLALYTVAANDRGRDIGGGMYSRTDSRGLPDVGFKRDRDAAIGLAAIFSGVCCPIVPYVVIMLILVTAYVAFRSAGL